MGSRSTSNSATAVSSISEPCCPFYRNCQYCCPYPDDPLQRHALVPPTRLRLSVAGPKGTAPNERIRAINRKILHLLPPATRATAPPRPPDPHLLTKRNPLIPTPYNGSIPLTLILSSIIVKFHLWLTLGSKESTVPSRSLCLRSCPISSSITLRLSSRKIRPISSRFRPSTSGICWISRTARPRTISRNPIRIIDRSIRPYLKLICVGEGGM